MFESLCALKFAASLFAACAPPPAIAGYVEGEYVLLAPIETAQIRELRVARGDRIEAGATVALLERSDLDIMRRDADARLAEAEAQLSDLLSGKRKEEIAVIEATLRSAEAQARDAARALARQQELIGRGATTQALFDQAQTARDVADARVGELRANLDVARLPARPDAIKAAQNRVEQTRTAIETIAWRLDQRYVKAQAPGRVYDVLRRVGELAGPSQPLVSMLPDGAVKLKIYAPEPKLSALAVGSLVAVSCDGCKAGMKARVTYVSPEPEFTPPVIYSLETRQKLVWLVEARPDGDAAAALQPGQIVDVRLDGAP